MATQNKALEQLKQKINKELISQFQNPIVFRITVITLIGALGIGALGMPLYFRIENLQQTDGVQRAKKLFIAKRENVDKSLAAFKDRLSPNLRYIEWMTEVRDLAKESQLEVIALNPKQSTQKNGAEIQKLIITAALSGTYKDMIQFIGTCENRKFRINIASLLVTGLESGKHRMTFELAMLLQPADLSEKKRPKSEEGSAAGGGKTPSKFDLASDTLVSTQTAKIAVSTQTVAAGAKDAAADKPEKFRVSKEAVPSSIPAVRVAEPRRPEPPSSRPGKFSLEPGQSEEPVMKKNSVSGTPRGNG
ncbi:MAG: hypothetical protein WCS77_07055 [Elusimicrobiaceae bacterium]